MQWVTGRSAVQLYSLIPSSLAESLHLLLLMHTSDTYNTYRTCKTVNTLRGRSFAINGGSPQSLDFSSEQWKLRKKSSSDQPASTWGTLKEVLNAKGSRIKGQRTLLDCPSDTTRHLEICTEISCLWHARWEFLYYPCWFSPTEVWQPAGGQPHRFWAAAPSGTATVCRIGQIYWKQRLPLNFN